MTHHQSPGSNHGLQPAPKTDWLEQLKDGSTDTEQFLRMEHYVHVKEETEKFDRGQGLFTDYRPFVSSVTYGKDGKVAFYGDPKPFEVTITRTNGAIEDGWQAVGLTQYVDRKDGSTKDGYLVAKYHLGPDSKIVRTESRVSNIIETEELTRRRKAEQQQRLAGASAATMAVGAPQAGRLITAAEVQAIMNSGNQESRPSATPEIRIESPQDREARVLAQFSESDREALSAFAYYAHAKRNAQLNNEGERSSDLGRDISAAYSKLSPEAKRRARGVASTIYGASNVAF